MEYKWIATTPDVYWAIYDEHKDSFSVFESYTEMDYHGERLKASITAWGFKNAEHPLIRSEIRNFNDRSYQILGRVCVDDV